MPVAYRYDKRVVFQERNHGTWHRLRYRVIVKVVDRAPHFTVVARYVVRETELQELYAQYDQSFLRYREVKCKVKNQARIC